MGSEKVIKAVVQQVTASRAIVVLPGGENAWMPAQEVYPDFRPHDDFRIVGGDLAGQAIEVIEYGQALDGKKLVSHIRVENDPWDQVATWEDKCVKVMEVTAVTNVRAVGIITPGIRGEVKLDSLRAAFPPSWGSFVKPLPGDEVAGWFSNDAVDNKNRIVTLDVLGYIQSLISTKDLLAPEVSSSNIDPEEAEQGSDVRMGIEDSVDENLDLRGFERILVVEDDDPFREALSDFLGKEGCDVLALGTYEETMRVIADEETHLDLSIIDVHLTAGANDYLGMKVAAELKSHHPDGRIVLMSMEDIDSSCESVKRVADLQISAFLAKPFTITHLYEAFESAHKAARPVAEVLAGGRPREILAADTKESGMGAEKLNEVAHRLRSSIDAEAVVLFSIDPSSYEVRIVTRSDPNNKYSYVKPRLDRSPIWDAAIDGEVIFEANASRPWTFAKHRYLQRAYGYESCIGMSVGMGRRSNLAYAVFAFHSSPHKFGTANRDSVELAARDLGLVLYVMGFKEELRQMKAFELMGKAYGSLAHDIGGSLSTIGIEAEKLGNLLDRKDYAKMSSIIADLKLRSETTTNIVNLFKAMARGGNRTVVDISMEDKLREVVRYFRKQALTKYGVESSFVCGSSESCIVRIPTGGLEQLAYNLLLNAADQIGRLREDLCRDSEARDHLARFGGESKGEIVVELQRVTDEDGRNWAVVLVHDNGPGIHRRDFDRIFDLHYTTKEEGCGMGLDICRNLVQSVKLGGRSGSLKVRRSILFVGTTFELRLPVA